MNRLIAIIGLCVLMTVSLTACQKTDDRDERYAQAETLLSEKSYDQAKAIYLELGTYSDAAQKVKLCDYSIGQDHLVLFELDQAIESFTASSGYLDSDAKRTEATALKSAMTSEEIDFNKQVASAIKNTDYRALYKAILFTKLKPFSTYFSQETIASPLLKQVIQNLNTTTFEGGYASEIFLLEDGSVKAFGTLSEPEPPFTDIAITALNWTGIVSVAASMTHFVGLKDDGTVVGYGDNTNGELDLSTWTDIIQVDAGQGFTIGLDSQGKLYFAGKNTYSTAVVNQFKSWSNIIQISAGEETLLGLRADRTVAFASASVGADLSSIPAWTDIQTIMGGSTVSFGLDKQGVVHYVSTNLATDFSAIDQFGSVTAIKGKNNLLVAIDTNGKLLVAGAGINLEPIDVSTLPDPVAISAGDFVVYVIDKDGKVHAAGYLSDQRLAGIEALSSVKTYRIE